MNDDLTLYEQTLTEIHNLRMSPLIPALPGPLATRRFAVRQRSAKGYLKVRSIDDFH